MTDSNAEQTLRRIGERSDHFHRNQVDEATVRLIVPDLLKLLGIRDNSFVTEYRCGERRIGRVDFAGKFSNEYEKINFFNQAENPDLILETKRSAISFSKNSKDYYDVVKQLKDYLLGSNCKSVKLGLIFNGFELQLFRKQSRLIYPLTPILRTGSQCTDETISILKRRINEVLAGRGSIISVWNNKGGVGKTSIAQSLAILLSDRQMYRAINKNNVLIIDYDHNQADLTGNCGFSMSKGLTRQLLELDMNGNLDIDLSLDEYFSVFGNTERRPRSKFPFEIKVLRADSELNQLGTQYEPFFMGVNKHPLRQLCLKLSYLFDYIIIDSPPNFEQSIFSKEAIMAADCILPIAQFANKNSMVNYANFITDAIKKAQLERNDGGPYSMGMWINKWRQWTDRYTKECISTLLESSANEDYQELKRILYKNLGNRSLRQIKERPEITRCVMDNNGLPGLVRFKSARDALKQLLSEFSD